MIYTVHTDGGSRGNPGPAAIGIVIETGGNMIFETGKTIGEGTNNTAEYLAVIEALDWFRQRHVQFATGDTIRFYLDSLLVVSQLNGVYKIKHPAIRTYILKIRGMEKEISISITYSHIPREQNSQADALVNRALDCSLM